MDLNYDYGDVVHTHKHIHATPDSHKQVVDHALKEWCHDLFGENADEECSELNEIKGHDIDDGSHEDLKISDIYGIIRDLQKLNGDYENRNETPKHIYTLKFEGYKLVVTKINIGQSTESPSPPPGKRYHNKKRG